MSLSRPLTLTRVGTRAELAEFIALPRRLHAGRPGYAPPLDLDRRTLLDPRRSAFLTHGEAAYWTARRDGRPVGRVSAQVDHLATGPGHEGVASFGCFDTLNDEEAAGALLAAAEGWARERGRHTLRGPFTLSINAETGLLIEGFEARPMLMMPWHPPHARALLEGAGYALVKRIDSYGLDLADPTLRARLDRLGLDRRRQGLTVRTLRRSHLAEDAEAGRRLFNAAWAGNWGFVPVPGPEMASLMRSFKPLIRPEHGVFVEREGRAVGFALFLPNLFDIAGDLGGAPSPLGWLRFGWRAVTNRFTSGRTLLFGVAPELDGSVQGASVALLLAEALVRRAASSRITFVECGWILEDNHAMTAVVRWLGAVRTRRFGLFEKGLVQTHAQVGGP